MSDVNGNALSLTLTRNQVNMSYAGAFTGSGTLTDIPSFMFGGSLTYTGTSGSNFTGCIVPRTLVVNHVTNFGSGWLAIASSNSASYNAIVYNDPASATISAPILFFSNSGTASIANSLSFAVNQGTLNWSGSINENPISTCTGTTSSVTNTYSINMRKTGTGTLVLSGANNFGGLGTGVLGNTNTVGNWVYGNFMPTAGRVDLANQNAVQSVIMSLGNGGTVVFDSSVASHTFTLGGLSGQGLLSLQDTAGNPINLVLANGTFTEYGGVLQGPGSFTEAGGTGGVTILYSPNTYAGSTTISGGTLQLADPHAVPATSTVYMSGAAT